jgi:hypothetical protein
MRLKPIVLFGFVVMIAGCADVSKQAPAPTQAMAEASGKGLDRLQRGHSVYLLKCGECHEAMMPDDVSKDDWHVVVPGMAWNAGISEAEEEAVLDYIFAAKSR